jgi:hypothetical protein
MKYIPFICGVTIAALNVTLLVMGHTTLVAVIDVSFDLIVKYATHKPSLTSKPTNGN